MIQSNRTIRNESLLQALSAQHSAITNNIANADTPNYKMKTVEFQEELRRSIENDNSNQLKMRRTHAKHFPNNDVSPAIQYRVVENNNTAMNNNNNNVDIDMEMSNLAENQMMYSYMVDRVSGHYTKMKDLLNNLK